jgi:hypothetical protein
MRLAHTIIGREKSAVKCPRPSYRKTFGKGTLLRPDGPMIEGVKATATFLKGDVEMRRR